MHLKNENSNYNIMRRLSILNPPIKNVINKYMPIVIDNIDKYILEMKNNSLTITLKTYDIKNDKKKVEMDIAKKREIFDELHKGL